MIENVKDESLEIMGALYSENVWAIVADWLSQDTVESKKRAKSLVVIHSTNSYMNDNRQWNQIVETEFVTEILDMLPELSGLSYDHDQFSDFHLANLLIPYELPPLTPDSTKLVNYLHLMKHGTIVGLSNMPINDTTLPKLMESSDLRKWARHNFMVDDQRDVIREYLKNKNVTCEDLTWFIDIWSPEDIITLQLFLDNLDTTPVAVGTNIEGVRMYDIWKLFDVIKGGGLTNHYQLKTIELMFGYNHGVSALIYMSQNDAAVLPVDVLELIYANHHERWKQIRTNWSILQTTLFSKNKDLVQDSQAIVYKQLATHTEHGFEKLVRAIWRSKRCPIDLKPFVVMHYKHATPDAFRIFGSDTVQILLDTGASTQIMEYIIDDNKLVEEIL